MERDSLGRFLPGNQVAKGNRGNRKPKTGNKNAFKHGLRQTYTGLFPSRNGNLSIYKNGVYLGSLRKECFHTTDKGEIMVDVKAVQRLIDVCGLPESLFGDPEYVEYYE